jgi:hypothetical protein
MTNDAPTCIDSDLDTCGFTQAPTSAPTSSQPSSPPSSPPTVADDLDVSPEISALSGEDDTGDAVEDQGSGSSTRYCFLVVLISIGMATLMS